MKKTQSTLIVAALAIVAVLAISSCSKTSSTEQKPQEPKPQSIALANKVTSLSSVNGSAGARPVYYDATLFTINSYQLSDSAAAQIIAKNTSHNVIYAYNDLDEPQSFNAVIDAKPTDGFNPLWLQMLIVFNPGFAPHQFFSDNEVLAAASGSNPEIKLVNSGEIYRCSVIGPK
ncbi:MAG: hypothetical protein JWR54_210 [Mucilaginibacter sp.]|nr:hypothetical protein [Mucilaginibacter sp.]